MSGVENSYCDKSRGSGLAIRARPQRPPWTDEDLVRQRCTSCGDCIKACPEGILVRGPARTPVVDFDAGACTFCGACADSCSDNVFQKNQSEPWNIVAEIGESCFLRRGISCQSCRDACDHEAMSYEMRFGVAGKMTVFEERCTGCGACVSVCPADAILMSEFAGVPA